MLLLDVVLLLLLLVVLSNSGSQVRPLESGMAWLQGDQDIEGWDMA